MLGSKIIIGIDPDSDKSGYAELNKDTKEIKLLSLTFPQLVDKMQEWIGEDVLFIVEAGWLIKTNWHLRYGDNVKVAAAKGNGAGRNHETGRKIVEMLEHYQIPHETIKPLKKCWKGRDGKITHAEIAYFIESFPKKSNQETRDAALIAWNRAGFPIRTKTLWQRKKK